MSALSGWVPQMWSQLPRSSQEEMPHQKPPKSSDTSPVPPEKSDGASLARVTPATAGSTCKLVPIAGLDTLD